MYSCTLPSTSALDAVGGQRHAPGLEENNKKNKNGILGIAESGNESYINLPKDHLWVLQHFVPRRRIVLLPERVPSFFSRGAAKTKRRERPLLTKEAIILKFS
jgi:hypothetical protein